MDLIGQPSLSISPTDLHKEETWVELGRGGFATVYKAFCPMHNCHVAVKKLFSRDEGYLREVRKLVMSLTHNHIIDIKGVDVQRRLILMELCPYSLQGLRDKLGQHFIPWPQCITFMQQIMSGLEYLHHNDIIHRDLKTGNVLVTHEFVCKIADLGLARTERSHTNSRPGSDIRCPSGTPVYISPQRWNDPRLDATEKDDLYSCAILIFKMITNDDMFLAENRRQDDMLFAELKDWVVSKYRPKIEHIHDGSRAPDIVETVILSCWDDDIEKRRTSQYWADHLRTYLTDNMSGLDLVEAKRQLRVLLSENGRIGTTPIPYTPLASSEHPGPAPEEETAVNSISTVDGSDSRATDRPIIEDGELHERMSNLDVNTDIDAMIIEDKKNLAQHFGLEAMRPYSLNFDRVAARLVFRCEDNEEDVIIPRSSVRSYRVAADTLSLYLPSGNALKLSVSSVERATSGLEGLAVPSFPEEDEMSTKSPLKTADYFEPQPSPPVDHKKINTQSPLKTADYFEPPHSPAIDHKKTSRPGHLKTADYPDPQPNRAAQLQNNGYPHADVVQTHHPKEQPPHYNESRYVPPRWGPKQPLQDGHFPSHHSTHHPSTGNFPTNFSSPHHWTNYPPPYYQGNSSVQPYSMGPQSQPGSIFINRVDTFQYSIPGHLGPRQTSNINQPPPYQRTVLTGSTAMVTPRDLMNVQDEVATAYERVGRLLGLQEEIGRIKREHRDDLGEASYQLLKTWLDSQGSDATRTRLATALYDAKLYDAAKRIV